MQKNKKRGVAFRIILIAAAVILLLELVLLLWLERKDNPQPTVSTPTITTTESLKEPVKLPDPADTKLVVFADTVELTNFADGQIQTPYFPLYYSEAFVDLLVVVKTADEPYTLEFYAVLDSRPEQRLFDIQLSQQTPGNLGSAKTVNGDVHVNFTFYSAATDRTWTDTEINTILAMQEAANDTINQMQLEDPTGQPGFQKNAPESSVRNLLTIQTPGCTLYYPVRWAPYLVTEQTAPSENGTYCVQFYGKLAGEDKCPLFSLVFGGDEGTRLGILQGETQTAVNLLIHPLAADEWDNEDTQILYAMQEAVNDLIVLLPLE